MLVAAEGLALVPAALAGPRLAPLRGLYWAWLGTLAGVIALSFLG